jgi:hypothetical protein
LKQRFAIVTALFERIISLEVQKAYEELKAALEAAANSCRRAAQEYHS